jgi:hypothetical protein
MPKKYYAATVHLIVSAESEDESIIADQETLESALAEGTVLDWGYVLDEDGKRSQPVEILIPENYEEADFYATIEKSRTMPWKE